ncbi:MAG: hypothetical protein WD894_20635 [Pirellulales bacterium]
MTFDSDENPYRSGQASIGEPSPKARSPLVWFFVEAAVLLAWTSLTLDLGQLFRVAAISVIAQACLILLIAARREATYTKFDVLVIKWGLVLTFILSVCAASLFQRLNL